MPNSQLVMAPPVHAPIAAFYRAPSPTGYGLFTSKAYQPGDWLFTLYGLLMLGGPLHKATAGNPENAFQLGQDFYLLPTTAEGLFLNHGCDPNAGLMNDLDVFARRPIEADEEIRIDYSTCIGESEWRMNCHCGSASCRGLIRSFPCLPPSLQQQYVSEGIVQQFLLEDFYQRQGRTSPRLNLQGESALGAA